MENLDIIVLSTVLCTLFVVFIILSYKEMKKLGDKSSTEEERGPRADMIRFIGKIFDEPVKTNEDVKTKLVVVKAIQRTISDMESDGVYFPVSVKESLRKKRDELTCEYSGLPAVSSYDE